MTRGLVIKNMDQYWVNIQRDVYRFGVLLSGVAVGVILFNRYVQCIVYMHCDMNCAV